MAKAKLNGALTQLSGRVGNLVFRQHLGTTVVAERPREPRKWTGAQADYQLVNDDLFPTVATI